MPVVPELNIHKTAITALFGLFEFTNAIWCAKLCPDISEIYQRSSLWPRLQLNTVSLSVKGLGMPLFTWCGHQHQQMRFSAS